MKQFDGIIEHALRLQESGEATTHDEAVEMAEQHARTTAPFDADGRPDKFHTFSGARDAAETPNAPRMSRAERLRNLREML